MVHTFYKLKKNKQKKHIYIYLLCQFGGSGKCFDMPFLDTAGWTGKHWGISHCWNEEEKVHWLVKIGRYTIRP